jgi:tetratricopeptide (TPR) repeat protein
MLGVAALAGLLARGETVAVLPFSNRVAAVSASQTNLGWIGESVAETVREALGLRGFATLDHDEIQEGYHQLRLRERTSLTEASAMKIGEALDAEQVIFGTFDFTAAQPSRGESRGSLRIAARIVDRVHLRQSPEFVETGALEDLATLEAHLAWRALTLLMPKMTPPESDFRTLRAPIRLDAEENYVRGLLARNPDQKERYFSQAARLDARFAHPSFQLGRIHYDRKDYRVASEWLEKVGPDDNHYREAAFILGLARFQSGDYAGAEKAFQVIVETVPLIEVYNNLGAAQSRRNLPQAIENFRKAADGDANDPVYHFNLGYALWKKGDFSAAADQFRAVLEREPEDGTATLLLGRCLKKQGLRAGDSKTTDARLQALERLKTNYEERAYRQLKAMLDPAKP